jgi:NADPH:quinone reductase-like Zn-dependent oxidoreductase
MCVRQDKAVRAPSQYDAIAAARLPVAAATTWRALFRNGALHPGETLLIKGAGAISTTAMQLAKAAGARCVSVLRHDVMPQHSKKSERTSC